MRAKAITTFRLFCAARRWPAASREAFVRKFGAAIPGLEAEVLALLGTDAPETGFLAPPMPRPEGAGAGVPGLTTFGGSGSTGRLGSSGPESTRSVPADAQGAAAGGADPAAASWVGRRLLSRYRLTRVLARGGAGTVYEADDEVARERVAVKVMHRPIAGRAKLLAHMRREVACLRLLRVPGVVQLHDDGIEDDRFVLAMDLVAGTPFPGIPGVVPWRRIAHATLALVETMDRIHALGVVHGDLKPINILVQADGTPVVLDLGVSGGPAIDVTGDRTGPVGATARYMSPEHARGDPVGAAADLYAIGLMVYEALSGRRPHDAQDVATLHEQRRSVRPPSLRTAAPTVEPEVAAWVDALLDGDPDARTRRAAAALAHVPGYVELPDRVAALKARDPRVPVPREDLEALFTGPRRIHHLPEDGAQSLLDRTDATPPAVIAELSAWVRAGLGRWDRDGVFVDRPALERLRLDPRGCRASPVAAWPADASAGDGAEVRLSQALASGTLEQLPAEAERFAEQVAPVGKSSAAQLALDEGVRAAQALGQQEVVERLLLRSIHVALDRGTVLAFDRLLHRIALLREPSERVRRIESLVRAALAGTRGETRSALGILASAGCEREAEIDVVSAALRIRSRCANALPSAEHEAVLSSMEETVRRFPGREQAFELTAWKAWLRYCQGLYGDAAALFRAAASTNPVPIRRASHLMQAAEAALEVYELEAAELDLAEVLAIAVVARHSLLETRAARCLRACAYRRERPDAPDLELVSAASDHSPVSRSALTWTEAAFAWRLGRVETAREILTPPLLSLRGVLPPDLWALGAAFGLCVGVRLPQETAQDAVRAAMASQLPGIACQTLALLGLRSTDRLAPHREHVHALADRIPRRYWSRRREILSVDEVLAIADGGPRGGALRAVAP